MWEYLKQHESFIRRALAGELGDVSLAELSAFHERQTARMQHERLIHLIVTMFVAAFWLLSLGYVSVQRGWAGLALVCLLLVLLVAYIVHYYRLENGVQRWYHLANRIEDRIGAMGVGYTTATQREPKRPPASA